MSPVVLGSVRSPFADRTAAGNALVPLLPPVAVTGDAVVLALPRGGVPVGAAVAAAIGAPLDVLVVRKLGVPAQPELAFGAVAGGEGAEPVQVRNHDVLRRAAIPADDVDAVVRRELAELRRRELAYRGVRPAVEVAGRVAVVVDDGLATGASARAALLAVREREPAAVVLAVPVAPRSALGPLEPYTDHLVCAAAPRRFGAVGRHYDDFRQVTDREVRRLLDR